jgi:Sigma-70 region 2
MTEATLRLVIAVAKRYRREGIALHDLVQEMNVSRLLTSRSIGPCQHMRHIDHVRGKVADRPQSLLGQEAP